MGNANNILIKIPKLDLAKISGVDPKPDAEEVKLEELDKDNENPEDSTP